MTLPNIGNVGKLRAARGLTPRFRGVAQSGSAPALGAGCRGFESLHPDQLLPVMPQGRELAFGSVRRILCLRFLMVAVAHQVEHRIVAPEVAGSRPVSHPTPHPFLVRAALGLCVAPRNQRRKSPARLIVVFRVVQGVADSLAQPSCPK